MKTLLQTVAALSIAFGAMLFERHVDHAVDAVTAPPEQAMSEAPAAVPQHGLGA